MSEQPHPNTQWAVALPDSLPAAPTKSSAPHGRTARPWRLSSRGLIFALLSAVCLASAVGYIIWAVLHNESAATDMPVVPVSAGGAEMIAELRRHPHLMFRSTALGDSFGKIALAPLNALDEPRTMTTLQCDRVHFAFEKGICLVGARDLFSTASAIIFGPDFQPRHTLPLSGIPSRARISPDGRYAAITIFVSGHSYAEAGFSTETTLIDTASGTSLGNLEEFTVWYNGKQFREVDFNFWGVTFARDSNRFYATLASGGKTYLVEGDMAAREVRVLHENVECPSLSPDNTRVAYKKSISVGANLMWQFHVLDLATMAETPLAAETRNIDDQVEWLDDNHILYALPFERPSRTVGENIWVLPTDRSGPPRMLLPEASSPTVVR